MVSRTSDTHAASIGERHAEAIVNTMREAASAERGEVATKGDIAGLEARVDARIAGLRADMFRAMWIQVGVLVASQVAIVSLLAGGGQ